MERRTFIQDRPRPARPAACCQRLRLCAGQEAGRAGGTRRRRRRTRRTCKNCWSIRSMPRIRNTSCQHRLSAAPSSTSSCASPCSRATVRTSSTPPGRAMSPRWRRPASCCRSTTMPQSSAGTTACCRSSSNWASTTASSMRCPRPTRRSACSTTRRCSRRTAGQPPTTIAELETLADAMLAKGIVPFGAGNADWRPTNEHYVSIVLNSIAGPDNVYKALTGEIPWTDPSPSSRPIDKLNEWWQKGYFGPNYFSLTARAGLRAGGDGPGRHGADRHLELPERPRPTSRRTTPSRASSASRATEAATPVYALGIGSTFSISAQHRRIRTVPRPCIDYVFSATSSTAT